MEPFIGQITIFAGNFAPKGWAMCDGRLLPISQYSALFSILGTTYGGDGRTTFALPDLRGRLPMHPGRGPGLTARKPGERGGTETVKSDTLSVSSKGGAQVMVVKGGAPQANIPPFTCVNFIIALQGVYPSRP